MFWLEDISVLFASRSVFDIIPTSKQDVPERLNSLTRFFIYLGIIVALNRKDVKVFPLIVIPSVVLLIAFYLHWLESGDEEAYDFEEGEDSGIFQDQLGRSYRIPTYANPYANPQPDDFGSGKEVPMTNARTKRFREASKLAAKADLVTDEMDVWEKRQGQLQFHTIPSAIPDQDGSFRNWIFDDVARKTRKELNSNVKPMYRNKKGEWVTVE